MNLLGPHRNGGGHTQRAADAMANPYHTMRGSDLTAVNFVDCQLALKQIDVTNKVRHKTAVRVFINFFWRADLQHAAMAHHGNAGGHGHGFFLVMRDQHTGYAHGFKNIDQFKLRAFAQFFIQRAQGLIEQ